MILCVSSSHWLASARFWAVSWAAEQVSTQSKNTHLPQSPPWTGRSTASSSSPAMDALAPLLPQSLSAAETLACGYDSSQLHNPSPAFPRSSTTQLCSPSSASDSTSSSPLPPGSPRRRFAPPAGIPLRAVSVGVPFRQSKGRARTGAVIRLEGARVEPRSRNLRPSQNGGGCRRRWGGYVGGRPSSGESRGGGSGGWRWSCGPTSTAIKRNCGVVAASPAQLPLQSTHSVNTYARIQHCMYLQIIYGGEWAS